MKTSFSKKFKVKFQNWHHDTWNKYVVWRGKLRKFLDRLRVREPLMQMTFTASILIKNKKLMRSYINKAKPLNSSNNSIYKKNKDWTRNILKARKLNYKLFKLRMKKRFNKWNRNSNMNKLRKWISSRRSIFKKFKKSKENVRKTWII